MTEPCVTRVGSSQFLEYDGSVRNAQTMTCAQFAITPTNTTFATDSFGSTLLAVNGMQTD